MGTSAPPEAITGTLTDPETAAVSAKSNPLRVPSRSMEVSRISPAPQDTPCCAHSTASRPLVSRPPRTKASQRSPTRLASIANTTACEPNSAASSVSNSGRRRAAVFTVSLSAPERRIARPSSTVATPPPAVSGMASSRATRRIVSRNVGRWSRDAAISSTTSSSAPSLL